MAMLCRPAPNPVATTVLLAGVALCLATMSWRLAGPTTVGLAATAAGLLLLVAGTAAHRQQPTNRIGLLMAAAGCAIFSEDLVMAHHGLLHTLGLILVEASTPLLVHAVLAFPRGRLESLPARILVVAAYVISFGGSTAQALFDGSAPIDLEYNRLLWHNDPATQMFLSNGQGVATGLLGLLIGAIAVHRAIRAQGGDRPFMVLLATGAAAGTALNMLVELAPRTSPVKATFLIIFYAVIMAFSIGLLMFLDRFADGLGTITQLARHIVPGQSLATTEALVRRSFATRSSVSGFCRSPAGCISIIAVPCSPRLIRRRWPARTTDRWRPLIGTTVSCPRAWSSQPSPWSTRRARPIEPSWRRRPTCGAISMTEPNSG